MKNLKEYSPSTLLGRILITAGGLLLFVALASQLWGQSDEALRVRALALENADGELVGMLSTDPDGAPFLALGTEDGPQVIVIAGPTDASMLLSAGENQVISAASIANALVVVTNGGDTAYLPADAATASKPLSWGALKKRMR